MNGFSGIWRLDGSPVDPESLGRSAFRSPLWEPDSDLMAIRGPVGFTCAQRFITPECSSGLMPFEDPPSGIVIVADGFLTGREELAQRLGMSPVNPDCALILAAWLKWGSACTAELAGNFSFVIWNARTQTMFAAVDPFGLRPFYYAHSPGGSLVFANTMNPFRVLCPHLSVNENQFAHFALDALPAGETCYREVCKLPAGHFLMVTSREVRLTKYWSLEDKKKPLPYKTRQEYYEAFRELFSRTVADCLRTDHGIMAHISGGMDSSSVACMAASQLEKSGRGLLGFTAAPLELEGPSHNRFWRYHELGLVEAVLKAYPNIAHTLFRTDSAGDPYEDQGTLYQLTDIPYRNVSNMHWSLRSMALARESGARMLLTGDAGNATISWTGIAPREKMKALYEGAKAWIRPSILYDGRFRSHSPGFLRSGRAHGIMRRGWVVFDWHRALLARDVHSAYLSGVNHPGLFHGVESLDPTGDIRLVEFCYNVPNWVYMKAGGMADRRLLVREALSDYVPEPVRRNLEKGEQSPDWYLQYNSHREAWRRRLLGISPAAGAFLWSYYDRDAVMALFDAFPTIQAPGGNAEIEVGLNLMSCLCLAFYLDYIERSRP